MKAEIPADFPAPGAIMNESRYLCLIKLVAETPQEATLLNRLMVSLKWHIENPSRTSSAKIYEYDFSEDHDILTLAIHAHKQRSTD